MKSNGVIGVIGGVGPYAGLDLVRKIFDNTLAARDQEHLPVMLASLPDRIADRTDFLLGNSEVNPAFAVIDIIRTLEKAGVTVIGIPCNTMHAPKIFEPIKKECERLGGRVALINMIEETAQRVQQAYPQVKKIGVLSTTGTGRSQVYPSVFEPLGFEVVSPDTQTQETCVHAAIYDKEYGIKARANPVTLKARESIERAIYLLRTQGAEAVILGCTELSPAMPEPEFYNLPIIDPTFILVRALVRAVASEKLRSYSSDCSQLTPHL